MRARGVACAVVLVAPFSSAHAAVLPRAANSLHMALLPSSLRCCAVAAELPSSGPPLLRRQPRSPAGASSAVRRAVAARAAAGDKSRAEQVLEMQRRLLDQARGCARFERPKSALTL